MRANVYNFSDYQILKEEIRTEGIRKEGILTEETKRCCPSSVCKVFRHIKESVKEQMRDQAVFCEFEDAESINMEKIFYRDRIWMLLKGEIDLVIRSEEGKTFVCLKIQPEDSGILLPVECCGSQLYGMEAVCVGKTALYYIPEELSAQIYRESAEVSRWQRELNKKVLLRLFELINDLALLSLSERLKKKLIEYCFLYQADTIVVTHERLAEELATSREVISRILKRMEVEGCIKVKRKRIQVLNLQQDRIKDQKSLM